MSVIKTLVLLFTCLYFSLAFSEDGKKLPSVLVSTAVDKNVSPTFEHVGRVEAIEKVELRARVEGFLLKKDFEEGRMVEDGQVLFEIEKDTYAINVEQKKADLMSAKATLKNAEADLKRKKTLIRKNLISKADLDTAEANRDTAKASVMQAEAQLKQAELDLSYTDITSPISGMIGITTYTKGNLISPSSDPLATVTSVDPIYVSIELSEKLLQKAKKMQLDNLREGAKAVPELLLSDGTIYPETGEFTFLGTEVDPGSDTVKVRATFPNPENVLLPGQFVTVMIHLKSEEVMPVIPQSAVQKDKDGYYVLVVDKGNKIAVRRVEVGRQLKVGEWAIKSGLKAGENVVVEGLQKVKPGVEVNPVKEKEQPLEESASVKEEA